MRPSENRIKLWPMAVIGFVLVLVILSVSSTVRLKPNAPDDFVNLPLPGTGRSDPQLGLEYWKVVTEVVQMKYARGSVLPNDPPPEFTLAGNSAELRSHAAIRAAYWRELRRLWSHPELWQTKYQLDLTWPSRAGQTVYDAVMGFVRSST